MGSEFNVCPICGRQTVQYPKSGRAWCPEHGIVIHPETPFEVDEILSDLEISKDRYSNTAFVGVDFGEYGISAAAMRMALEGTVKWEMRTIVFDFYADWRELQNEPDLKGRVEVLQLSPNWNQSPRWNPLRWNPLQIGRHILPEVQWRAFCDIFGAVARLGVRRQVVELRDALRRVYLAAGVLVDDPELPDEWAVVRTGEGATVGVPLADLSPEERQRIAVQRSKVVGLADLYAEIESRLSPTPPQDAMPLNVLSDVLDERDVLGEILFRLSPLVADKEQHSPIRDRIAMQYAAGPDAIDINEIVPGDWGIVVLERGELLDELSQAFLMGWAAWQIYTDTVVQHIKEQSQYAPIQFFFNDADSFLSEENEQFNAMWRDSRKYGIWLHLITQHPALLSRRTLLLCDNLFVAQISNPQQQRHIKQDQDAIIERLHNSQVGFTDKMWRQFIASLPLTHFVIKLSHDPNPIYMKLLLKE